MFTRHRGRTRISKIPWQTIAIGAREMHPNFCLIKRIQEFCEFS